MKTNTEINGATTILHFQGDVDRMHDMLAFRDLAAEQVRVPASEVILDFASAGFVTASICGFLVSVIKTAKQHHSSISLVVDPGHIFYDVLRIAGFQRVVDVFPSMDALRQHLLAA